MERERTPISGRVLWSLHLRYIQERKRTGTDTEESLSMPVLVHLEDKGVIRGLPAALRECAKLTKEYNIKKEDPIFQSEFFLFILYFFTIVIGSIEFALIATRLRICKMDGAGHWDPFK